MTDDDSRMKRALHRLGQLSFMPSSTTIFRGSTKAMDKMFLLIRLALEAVGAVVLVGEMRAVALANVPALDHDAHRIRSSDRLSSM